MFDLELESTGVIWSVSLLLLGIALSVAATIFVIVKLPANYFQDAHSHIFMPSANPVVRWIGLIAKNLLGCVLIVLGIVLSLPGVPGPGLLLIVIGISLVNIPGKHRLVGQLVGRPSILRPLNRVRRHFGKPPLVHEEPA